MQLPIATATENLVPSAQSSSFALRASCNLENEGARVGQLLFASSGVSIVTCPEHSWVIGPDRALWIPPGGGHQIRPMTDVKLSRILLPEASGADLQARFCLIQVNSFLKELVLKIASAEWSGLSVERKKSVVDLLFGEMKIWQAPPIYLPMPVERRLKRICSELLENPADVRTLEQWSQTAGASSRTISRLFLKETGLSFAAWRRQARLLAALVFLGKGQSVTAIALDVGYESTSAFIGMFKKRLGNTPGQYS